MFFRLYRYSLMRTMRQKITIFWNLIFPILLGTLFQIAFGNYTDKTIMFHQIPVAYVEGEEADENFTMLLDTLETENELIQVQSVEEKEAERLLEEDKVKGIFYNGRILETGGKREEKEKVKTEEEGLEIFLTVKEEGISQSILSIILEQFERTRATFTRIGKENPAAIQEAAKVLEEECQYLKEGSVMDTPANSVTDYFYSLIAMHCLMGATIGLMSATEFKANLNPLGTRRVVTGTRRFGILLPDLAANITIQFFYMLFFIGYLTYVLDVHLGDRWGLLLLTVLMGDILGIVLGFLIGVLGKLRYNVKEGLCIMIMMVSSFFSGLMMAGMLRVVETYAPFFNRINPAALIVRALYSLNIYDTYDQYIRCMGNMLLLILILGGGAFGLVRRERYASI
ncbi:MAG: ABC transporter permease [Lachnospiraceae bacterium]|nr:ABC transporter permease [Lachnospiraceae bacterium]